jgi:hypothetical protein
VPDCVTTVNRSDINKLSLSMFVGFGWAVAVHV